MRSQTLLSIFITMIAFWVLQAIPQAAGLSDAASKTYYAAEGTTSQADDYGKPNAASEDTPRREDNRLDDESEDDGSVNFGEFFIFSGKILLVVILSSFMAATAVSFLKVRLEKKETHFKNIIKVLGIDESEARLFTPAVMDEYSPKDYWLPIAFATAVCLIGFITLIFGREIIAVHEGRFNIILTGINVDITDSSALQLLRRKNILVLTMAFIGSFMWSAKNIIRRLSTGDLTPTAYFSAGLRMLFAPLVALMLSYFIAVFPSSESTDEIIKGATLGFTEGILPVIAFFTGMLPEQALVYMRDRIGIFSRKTQHRSDEMPLDMIEGISMFHKVRLNEVGIDNAENLAEANLIELLLKTPFGASILIDWIAQAKLFIYFKNDISALRNVGIRNIFDFKSACTDDEHLNGLAEKAEMSGLMLKGICLQTRDDTGIDRLNEFRLRLNTFGQACLTNTRA